MLDVKDTMTLAVTSKSDHDDICDVIESSMMPESVRMRFFKKVPKRGYCYYEIVEPDIALRLVYHELELVIGSGVMWDLMRTLDRLERLKREQTKLHQIGLLMKRAWKHFS